MKLTFEQQETLAEELTQAQHDAWPGVDADFIVNTEAIMPIIERLVAASYHRGHQDAMKGLSEVSRVEVVTELGKGTNSRD